MNKRKQSRGFTLLELMVTMIIIGVLAAIALPMYKDNITKSKFGDATSALSTRRVQAEQYFQDNRTYANIGDFVNQACVADTTSSQNFDFACTTQTATNYTIQATGKGGMAGFSFSIDDANVRKTVAVASGWTVPSGNCWITGKGGSC